MDGEETKGHKVGEVIREIRKRYRLSLAKLGKIAGVSASAVFRWAKGDRTPKVEHLGPVLAIADKDQQRRILEALDLPVELFEREILASGGVRVIEIEKREGA